MMGEIFRTFLNVVMSGMGNLNEATLYSGGDFATLKVTTPEGSDLTINLSLKKKTEENEKDGN